MARLTDEAFRAWCQRNQISPATETYMQRIRSSARLDYYRQILDQLRRHVGVRDRVLNLALARSPEKKSRDPAEWLDMREAVVYALELLRVKVVFVDEAQHLMYVDTPHKSTAQLDWLKALTNRTNILHALVGNFDLYDFCHLNAQATRRFPSHDKRKRRTPQTERRWAMGEITWEVMGGERKENS